MERKALTLNEVLNLNRRPTLQEMVDLSVEDYVKYLYCKGIIKYMPENIYEYKDDINDIEYNARYDPGLYLRKFDYKYDIDDTKGLNDKELKDLNEELEFDIIEKGIIYVNEKKFYYELESEGWLSVYQIRPDGKKISRGGTQTWINSKKM